MSNDARDAGRLKMPTPDLGFEEPIKGEWHWWYRLPGPGGIAIWEDSGTVSSSGDASRALETAQKEGVKQWRDWCQLRGL